VTREIERAVIGGDWGANGYTSRAQADRLGRLLELGPGRLLLDLGAGRGWPGLYLGASTGCQVVLTDVPVEGLASAMGRVAAEQMGGRAAAVGGSARRLPLRAGSVDAVVHTDVLCCLRPKISVLRECHRLLRVDGRTAFTTIHPAPDLTRSQRRRASRDGPICVAIPRPNRDMLAAAGFVDIGETDCTEDFARVARAWIEQWDGRRPELVKLLGEEAVAQRQADRRAQLRAVEDGILRRSLLWARKPAPWRAI
jgi:ubiquinone/menaquinone biosynthesis C-methylase UbiE